MRNITARKESEIVINDLIFNDQLTELLNRTAFRKRIYEEIQLADNMTLTLIRLF